MAPSGASSQNIQMLMEFCGSSGIVLVNRENDAASHVVRHARPLPSTATSQPSLCSSVLGNPKRLHRARLNLSPSLPHRLPLLTNTHSMEKQELEGGLEVFEADLAETENSVYHLVRSNVELAQVCLVPVALSLQGGQHGPLCL